MGCGTGVPGILSCLCGASDVTALEIREESIRNTRNNAEPNNITNLKVLAGDKESIHKDNYDIIPANITRNVLIDYMPAYAKMCHPGSTLLISGLLLSDLPDMRKDCDREGFRFLNYKLLDPWVMMMFSRK